MTVVFLNQLADGKDIFRTLDEGSRDEVHFLLAAKDDVTCILL